MTSNSVRRFFFYIAPVIVWMLIIFGWSTDVGSSAHTTSFIERLVAAIPLLRDNLTMAQVGEIDHIIRKSAHVIEYAIFATLAFRALRQDSKQFHSRYIWGPILLCFLYASTDEYHQTFVASRGPSVFDVLFDTTGGTLGTVINWLWFRRFFSKSTPDRE